MYKCMRILSGIRLDNGDTVSFLLRGHSGISSSPASSKRHQCVLHVRRQWSLSKRILDGKGDVYNAFFFSVTRFILTYTFGLA